MLRIPRMYLYTEYFYIITQGINNSYIFDENTDIKFYIKKMYELDEKHKIKMLIMNIYLWILMIITKMS